VRVDETRGASADATRRNSRDAHCESSGETKTQHAGDQYWTVYREGGLLLHGVGRVWSVFMQSSASAYVYMVRSTRIRNSRYKKGNTMMYYTMLTSSLARAAKLASAKTYTVHTRGRCGHVCARTHTAPCGMYAQVGTRTRLCDKDATFGPSYHHLDEVGTL